MRKNLLVAAMLMSALGAFGQGAIKFDNRATTAGSGPQSPVVAPIFGVDPACPTCQKYGAGSYSDYTNRYGANAPSPQPTGGSQIYAGAALQGTGFTATLWAVNADQADDQLQLISTTAFRTQTTLSLVGYVVAPTIAPVVPGAISDPSVHAKFQVRVWDNQGGTITTWAQVLANPNIPRGLTPVITLPYQLGGGSVGPPNDVGWESFQLFVVPEPSVIALGVLGAGCLLLLRRRK